MMIFPQLRLDRDMLYYAKMKMKMKMKEKGLSLIEHERLKSSMNTRCSFRRAHYVRSSVRRNESFTLVELLVVLAIIVLVVSIALASISPKPQIKARNDKRQMDIKEIMKAMEMCYNDDNQYPNITVDAQSRVTNTSISSAVKTYLSPFPKDPDTTNYYGKANAANRLQYCIYTILESVSPTTYFCASEKGVKSSTTTPSLGACCF